MTATSTCRDEVDVWEAEEREEVDVERRRESAVTTVNGGGILP